MSTIKPGHKLMAAAKALRLEAIEIADILGVSRSAVYAYGSKTRSNSPTFESITKFVAYANDHGLPVTRDWFYNDEPLPTVAVRETRNGYGVDNQSLSDTLAWCINVLANDIRTKGPARADSTNAVRECLSRLGPDTSSNVHRFLAMAETLLTA